MIASYLVMLSWQKSVHQDLYSSPTLLERESLETPSKVNRQVNQLYACMWAASIIQYLRQWAQYNRCGHKYSCCSSAVYYKQKVWAVWILCLQNAHNIFAFFQVKSNTSSFHKREIFVFTMMVVLGPTHILNNVMWFEIILALINIIEMNALAIIGVLHLFSYHALSMTEVCT